MTTEGMCTDVKDLIDALEGSVLPGANELKAKLQTASDDRTREMESVRSATSGLLNREPDPQQERNIEAAFSSACRRAVMAHKTEVMQYKGLDKLKSMLNSFVHKYCGFELFKIKAKEISSAKDSGLDKAQQAVERFSSTMKR